MSSYGATVKSMHMIRRRSVSPKVRAAAPLLKLCISVFSLCVRACVRASLRVIMYIICIVFYIYIYI